MFMTAEHYTNEGGAVDVRNVETEQFNIGLLRSKWPGVFLDQKRVNEVIMRWDYFKAKDATMDIKAGESESIIITKSKVDKS
jgi:hypothetical protein